MNLLHDIPAGDPQKHLNVIIEIPQGSRIKYEYDSQRQIIKADRFLYTAFTYPFNYGFIPGTWSQDEDPLDVVVLSSEPLTTGTLIECRLLGLLASEDEEGPDAKLIAAPAAKVDPAFSQFDQLAQLDQSVKNKVQHFFENYKTLEPGKWVKVTGWQSREEAVKQVQAAISRYQKNFKK